MTIYEKNNILVSIDEVSGEVISTTKLNSSKETSIAFELNEDETVFFKNELDIEITSIDKKLYADVNTVNNIIRMCFSIESSEVEKDGVSKRGKTAISICNKLSAATL